MRFLGVFQLCDNNHRACTMAHKKPSATDIDRSYQWHTTFRFRNKRTSILHSPTTVSWLHPRLFLFFRCWIYM